MKLLKDNSFNRSFERDNGYSFMLVDQKRTSDFSLFKGNSLVRNSSIEQGFSAPTGNDANKPVNLFVDMADCEDDKNDDFINVTLFAKGCSSIIKPAILRDISALSMNVLTGNEDVQQQLAIKKESDQNVSKQDIEKASQDETTNEKSEHNCDSYQSNNSSLSQDSGDVWVQSQHRNFNRDGYNWNQEVEFLLDDEDLSENGDSDYRSSVQIQPIKYEQPPKVNIRRHRKKSKRQLEVLESHFDLDVEWSLDLVETLAHELGLEKDQVYKWNWDKRKRLRRKLAQQGRNVHLSHKMKTQKSY